MSMKTLFSPLVLLLLSAVFICHALLKMSPFNVLLVAVAIAVGWKLITNRLVLRKAQLMDLAAYQAKNPSCYIVGKLSCSHCSGENISAATSRLDSRMREHSCLSCGSVLFYSPKR